MQVQEGEGVMSWHQQAVEEFEFHGESQKSIQGRATVLQSNHQANPLVVAQGPLTAEVLPTCHPVCLAVL